VSNVKHQLIQYNENSGFDNSVDPTTKLQFGSGDNVVVCRDKNSLISLRSLKANAYQCPFCLNKLNTELAIVGAANVNEESKKSIDSSPIHHPIPQRQQPSTSPVLWGGMAGVILLCLVVVVMGFVFLNASGGGAINPPPINTRVEPIATEVLPQPPPVDTPRKLPTSEPTKTVINSSKYAKVSCAQIYNVNLRRTPGYVGKDNSTDSIYEVPCGETVELLGPTQHVDSLTWWKVSWNGYTGWIADHTASGKIIIDFNP